MSIIPSRVRELIAEGKFRVSVQDLRELGNDERLIGALISGVQSCTPVEDYLDYHKGSCVLVLQTDEKARPIHLLRDMPAGFAEPPYS